MTGFRVPVCRCGHRDNRHERLGIDEPYTGRCYEQGCDCQKYEREPSVEEQIDALSRAALAPAPERRAA